MVVSIVSTVYSFVICTNWLFPDSWYLIYMDINDGFHNKCCYPIAGWFKTWENHLEMDDLGGLP